MKGEVRRGEKKKNNGREKERERERERERETQRKRKRERNYPIPHLPPVLMTGRDRKGVTEY